MIVNYCTSLRARDQGLWYKNCTEYGIPNVAMTATHFSDQRHNPFALSNQSILHDGAMTPNSDRY